MDRFNKLPPMTKMMGPLEREWDKDEACWTDVCRKADELISKLEARVSALEERSCCPLPPPERETAYVIGRLSATGHFHIYDREDGFVNQPDCPAMFSSYEKAHGIIDALDLRNASEEYGRDVYPVLAYTDTLERVGD